MTASTTTSAEATRAGLCLSAIVSALAVPAAGQTSQRAFADLGRYLDTGGITAAPVVTPKGYGFVASVRF